MPTTRANGHDLFYTAQGSGEPLLLISGFAADHTIWTEVAAKLAVHFRVITFDNRGVGQSGGSESARNISIRQMADDAAGLLDALGLSSVHIAGHSMGGLIAQEMALARPKLVRSLALLSSCARTDARNRAIIESWGDLPSQVGAETATRLILPWVYTNDFYARPGAVENLISLILSNPHPPSLNAIYGQSRALVACNTLDRLKDIGCPTLALVGSEDILLPVACSEELARGIHGAELVVLERTGHGLLVESPEAVVGAMLNFLKSSHSLRGEAS